MIGVLANQKGGVAKTTNTLHLGASLSSRGFKVLLIDFDSQCDLSHNIGIKTSDNVYDVIDLMEDKTDFAPVGKAPNLFIVSGSVDLVSYKYKLNSLKKTLYKNRKGFIVADYFDFILIDCPPSNIIVGRNSNSELELALYASDFFIIPLKADEFSIKNADTFLGKTDAFLKEHDISINFLGFFFGVVLVTENSYEYYSSMIKDGMKQEGGGDLLFNSYIRQDSEVKKAVQLGKTIFQHKPLCRASQDYTSFANEFLLKVKNISG